MDKVFNYDPVLVTNTDFLHELAQGAPDGSLLWVCRFHGEPSAGSPWGGMAYTPRMHSECVTDGWGDYNTYFSVAAIKPGSDGEFHRRLANFSRMLALVVDDVDLETLLSPPSWVLETSPGKIQAGWFLDPEDPDCENEKLCSKVVTRLAKNVKADKSGNNAIRYVRLPVGTNQKPRDSGHFRCRLSVWRPNVRLSLDDACAAVGLELEELRNQPTEVIEWRPKPELRTSDGVAEGSRNETLFKHACSLRSRNLDYEEAKIIILHRASMCRPPMSEDEAMRCLDSAWKYPAGRSKAYEEAEFVVDPETGELKAKSVGQERDSEVTIDMESIIANATKPKMPVAQMPHEPSLPAPVEDADSEGEDIPDIPDWPEYLLRPGGIVQDIMDWILSTAQRPQPVLALMGALSLVGTVLGNRIATSTNLRTNYYFLGVAGTGAGKDHARKCIKTLLRAADCAHLLGGEEIASGQALLSRVGHHPVTLFQIDEFGLMLKAVNGKNASSHLAAIPTNLMKLFTSAGDVYYGTEYADQKLRQRVDIAYPCAVLHGTTTAETLWPSLQSQDMLSGYMNRILIGFAPAKRIQKRHDVSIGNPPQHIVEWIKAARSMSCGIAGMDPANPIVVRQMPMAAQIMHEFDEAVERHMHEVTQNGVETLWTRALEHAAKIAIGLACSRFDAQALTEAAATNTLQVDPTSARFAVDLVGFMLRTTEEQVLSRMGDSEFDRQVQEVLRIIKRKGRRGLTQAELARFSRMFKSLKPMEQDAIVEALKRREEVTTVEYPPLSGRGKARVALVWTGCLA